ncbi:ATP-binding response regulator [Alsobacter ponti]|uniref:ATP-binding response regulator n=1 Tax=Alsobacter ponti TaxID=2962936 RepID=UPI003FCE6087
MREGAGFAESQGSQGKLTVEQNDVLSVVDDAPPPPDIALPRQKIAVVDDDEAVHEGTRFALAGYRLNGAGLEILSAYSAAEARELLRAHPDIAVMLLDVVMETDTSGLDLVDHIRRDMGNETLRIILRTGQPGQAPERDVVLNYDINDYKAKTELTADKLFTALTSALRGHAQLRRIVDLQEELRQANRDLEHRVQQRTAELLAANKRVEAQWARARRASAFQNEILGIVAHDLKNPLSIIMGRTEILREIMRGQAALEDAATNQIERIRESARRLTAMVDALIKDAMTDALDLPVHLDPTDIVAVVQEAVEANRPLAQGKQQTLLFEGPGRLDLLGDHERLREAVDNLVSNAVKYSPPGGEIVVSAGETGGEAYVTVRDSGPGLLPEDFPRLFGRFQRLSARPTGGENSTGLGLFIAKRIVDLHGGRIEVDSPGPGMGASFTIWLQSGETAAEAAA